MPESGYASGLWQRPGSNVHTFLGQAHQWVGTAGVHDTGGSHRPARGGRYRFTMQPPEGEAFHLSGAFLELTQGEFATEERLQLHRGGWADSFGKLAAILEAGAA